MLAIGYWLLAIGYWLLAIGYWLLAIGYWLLAISYWLLAFGWIRLLFLYRKVYRPLTHASWLRLRWLRLRSATGSPLTTHHSLLITHHSSLTTPHSSLPTTYYQLPTPYSTSSNDSLSISTIKLYPGKPQQMTICVFLLNFTISPSIPLNIPLVILTFCPFWYLPTTCGIGS